MSTKSELLQRFMKVSWLLYMHPLYLKGLSDEIIFCLKVYPWKGAVLMFHEHLEITNTHLHPYLFSRKISCDCPLKMAGFARVVAHLCMYMKCTHDNTCFNMVIARCIDNNFSSCSLKRGGRKLEYFICMLINWFVFLHLSVVNC